MKSCAPIARAASSTSALVAPGRPKARLSATVAEAHAVEAHGAAHRAGGHRLPRLGHRRRLVQHAGELLERRGPGLQRVVELAQLLHGLEEAAQVEQEG